MPMKPWFGTMVGAVALATLPVLASFAQQDDPAGQPEDAGVAMSRSQSEPPSGAALTILPAEAQPREPTPIPGTSVLPPILAWLVRNGVQVTALGEIGGMDGYFLVRSLPDNTVQQQVAYLAPSGTHLIVGRMFDAEGNDMTARQLQELHTRMAAVFGVQPPPSSTQASPSQGASPGAIPPPAAGIAAPAGQGLMGNAAAQQAAAVAAGAARAPEDALRASGWFEVGRQGRPVVWFVADPSCPFCHQAWRILGPMVERGEIAVRVVLVANSASSLVEAAWVMEQERPAEAWMQGFARGERQSPEDWQRAWHAALTGARPMTTRQSMLMSLLQGNGAIASSLGVRGTPWLAFGHNGQWRTMVGMGDIAAFLAPLREAGGGQAAAARR